ncbi:MAG TPA: gliding motility-associated C-terminal domain-containing protein, partial [Bacteroidia bacterium]|nr:gliding motility-associated C-terminal domain-containing protein [Bacteroidia bacterium]
NGGCKDSVSDTVFVIQTIYIPNVFTPNNDGINDVFHVTMGGMKTYYIEIFNRWGERLFMANSPNIDWDGRSSAGVDESDGIYYYVIKAADYTGKQYNFQGYLQLIRN